LDLLSSMFPGDVARATMEARPPLLRHAGNHEINSKLIEKKKEIM
jgi:hypothetical protein